MSDSTAVSAQIEAFWDWFSNHQPIIREVITDPYSLHRETVVTGMDNHILSLGLFTWEIGHGEAGQYSLTVSPNGDRERLAISRQLMREAPALPNWELYPAKQPNPEGLQQLSLYDEAMNLHQVDATDWQCVVTVHPNGLFEVLVAASNIEQLDDETKLTAAEMAVGAVAGEEVKINQLAALEVCTSLNDDAPAIRIGLLRQQVLHGNVSR